MVDNLLRMPSQDIIATSKLLALTMTPQLSRRDTNSPRGIVTDVATRGGSSFERTLKGVGIGKVRGGVRTELVGFGEEGTSPALELLQVCVVAF